MNGTRRDFNKLSLSGLVVLFQPPVFAASARDTTQRGVKLGITTGSLNPLPEVSGKDRLDTIVDECVQLGCGNVELAAGWSRLARRRSWWPGAERNHYGISEIARATT